MLRDTTNHVRRDQRGFTMVTVMLAMMVLSMLAVGAYAGTVGDMPIARKDQDRKGAYEAAQAGVDWYMNLLRADPDYWTQCAPATASNQVPLTLEGAGSQGAWQPVSGSVTPTPSEAKFRVEIMNGRPVGNPTGTPCSKGDPSGTALDPKGRFWIRATGVANGRVRSVLAALQQNSDFLRYVYFSNWESQDPQLANASRNWDPSPAPNGTSGGNVNQCDYIKQTRDLGPRNQIEIPFSGGQHNLVCLSALFKAGDTIKGSVHTNDGGIMACGAVFGRDSKDTLEVAGATSETWNARTDLNSYPNIATQLAYTCPSGSTASTPLSEVKAPTSTLQLPPSNVSLLEAAKLDPKGVLTGQTCIEFLGSGEVKIHDMPGTVTSGHTQWGQGTGTKLDPKGVKCDGPGRTSAIPDTGVFYVKNDPNVPCTPRYGHNATTSYTSSPYCGDVAVKGTYPKSVTIGAENDIIITGDLKRSGNAMLGLAANGFVRIYHPLTDDPYRMSNQETNVGSANQAQWLWCYNEWYWGAIGDCNHQDWAFGPWFRKNPAYDAELASYWPCANMKNLQGRGEGGRMDTVDPSVYTPVKEVEAAILSMKHTFQTDNLVCGKIDDELKITGSISTYWGPGLGGKITIPPIPIVLPTGYTGEVGYQTKTWTHDKRFLHGQPPHFIAPLNSDGRWVINRRTEQIPTPVGPT